MTKREAKSLAVEFAKLRPRNTPKDSPLDELWLNMVHAVSEHIPSNLANAFGAACANCGLWMKEYER